MDPFELPQVHLLVLSFCDLETLKSARLVSKAWNIATTLHMRKKSIIDLTDSNLPKLVETLQLNHKLFRIDTFPATSFRIRHSLRETPSFTKFFILHGPKLVEMLETGVIPFVQTFAQCIVGSTKSLLSNLKEFRIARLYNSWDNHSLVVSERVETRISMYETLFTMAPNLNMLHFDTRLGPSEWLRFIQVVGEKAKHLRRLYLSLFTAEDSDEYFTDGEFKKDFKLDNKFLQGLPSVMKQIASLGSFQLVSLSLSVMIEEKFELRIEIFQALLGLLALVKDTLRHLQVTFIYIHPHQPDSSIWLQTVESSFPVLPRLENLNLYFHYTESSIFQKLPLNKLPNLKKFAISFLSSVRVGDSIDSVDMEEWISMFSYQSAATVEHLDLENFTLVAFSPEMLPRITSKFLALKTLKIDFHPTSQISADNLQTIFMKLGRIENLCIQILGSTKDFFGLDFPRPEGVECKMEQVLEEGRISWTEVLTGIPSDALKMLRKMSRDGVRIEQSKIQSLRAIPSLVDLERLTVLQIVDKSSIGILNDDICRFGLVHMKRLRQLHLSSTRNMSEACLIAMKCVLDIRKCKEIPVKNPSSSCRLTQSINEDESSSSDNSL